MTATGEHLISVFNIWCGAKPGQYTGDSLLTDIWTGSGIAAPYEPEGIKRLFGCLYADQLFQPCPAAHGLIPGEFFKGGDIQTVIQLYKRLLPCGNYNPSSPGVFK